MYEIELAAIDVILMAMDDELRRAEARVEDAAWELALALADTADLRS